MTINAFKNVWNNLDWSYLSNIVIRIIPALLALSFHEFSHALAAHILGDNTAKEAGRLSLNPIKHIDPMGLIMLLVFKFGWAKPVPVRSEKFRNPRLGMAVTALAGPLSNFILAFLALSFLFIFEFFVPNAERYAILMQIVAATSYLSIAFGIFNMFPFPPLDGSKIFFSILPDRVYYFALRYENYGIFALLLIIVALNRLGINIIGDFTAKIYHFFFIVLNKFFTLINTFWFL